MSRFIELAHSELLASINMRQMDYISKKVIESMADIKVQDCWIRAEFTYMISQQTPNTKKPDMIPVKVMFELTRDSKYIGISVPATTLCPCSKEISTDGAHNQRAEIRIITECLDWVWLEDLYDIASQSASSPCHSILKRPDEKFVTEEAYEHPKFVEDVMRECIIGLTKFQSQGAIGKFRVRVTSFESIHPHDAFAEMEVGRNGQH